MDPFWTPSIEDIKKYFDDDEWSKLTSYDKKNYINILENYNMMKDLDMNPEEPDFIKAKVIKRSEDRTENATCINTSNSSDVDMTQEITGIPLSKVTPDVNKGITPKKKGRNVKNNNVEKLSSEKDLSEPLSNVTKDINPKKRGRKAKNNNEEKLSSEKDKLSSEVTTDTNKEIIPKKRGRKVKNNNEEKLSTEKDLSASNRKGEVENNKKIVRKKTNKFTFKLFTEQEVLESVILDNTVGALYEYCLSELSKESCVLEKNTVSTSPGSNKRLDLDCLLKFLADIECTDERLSEDHEHIYCNTCQRFYDFFCPYGHRTPLKDLVKNSQSTPAQVPDCLALGTSGIPESGIGVWSTAVIEKGVVWGPFEDTVIPEISENKRERTTLHDKLNYLLKDFSVISRTWNTIINCARNEGERNVFWFRHKKQVYYQVCKKIPLATEILMFYTKEDIEKIGIDPLRVDQEKLEVSRQGTVIGCKWCNTLFANARFLSRHEKVCAIGLSKSKLTTGEDLGKPINNTSDLGNIKMQNESEIGRIQSSAVQKVEIKISNQTVSNDVSRNAPHYSSSLDLNVEKTNKYCSNNFRCESKLHETDSASKNMKIQDVSSVGMREYVRYRFKCDVCGKYCYGRKNIELHKKLHTKYSGNVHNKGFTTSGDLKIHKRTHTGERPYRCDVCDKGFTSSSDLAKHKRTHTGEGHYRCDICNKGFTTSGNLTTHKRTHTGERPYRCDVCDKGFTRSDHLTTHKRTHTGERPYRCDVCDKGFTRSSLLTTHKRTHTGERPYRCDVCDKGFTSSSDLTTHKRTHTGERPYRCDVCDKGFTRSSLLTTHKRTHTGERPYRCDVCDKGFTRSSLLTTHKRTHTGERPYGCDVCDKGFTSSSDLAKHKRTHTGERPYRCDVCDKGFTRSSLLTTHKRTHTGERPYRCDVCDKGFTSSSDLAKHKRTHTGERPYRCDVCDKGFTSSSDLAKHKRTHTGERPYSCDVCDKGVTSSSDLTTHKRTHTGRRPYRCDVCDKGFTSSSDLTTHKRTHTGERPYRCDVCDVSGVQDWISRKCR